MNKETTGDNRLVVVSNRLPFTLKQSGDGWRTERSAGGLATAMGPILEQTEGIWIGWSGEASDASDEKREKLLARWAERERYFAVELPSEMARGFYEGFANQTLWPLFHHFPFLLKFDPANWRSYREANQRFCDVILTHLRPDDHIWIHDYQLMLLPQMLRAAAPEARIGFFLHIPFPSSSAFRLLPRREELLQGLLGADYLAFHTYGYLQHFRTSTLRILGIESEMDRISVGTRSVRLDALPIGIAPQEFTDLVESDETTRNRIKALKAQYGLRRILLGVDRLDYTKGIPERLRTFRHLLKQNPELHNNVVLIQVAVPSRELITMYKEIRQEVDELVGEINGEFSTPEWTPIVYIRRGVPRTELAALYAVADVALVTPLRDGLNLVAKEYVACQRQGAGVLVLSEFAGAAAEMGEALLVNPYDEEGTAEAIARALALPREERHERMTALHRRVVRNNVFTWADHFLNNLREAAASRMESSSEKPVPLPVAALLEDFRAAARRRLLLDYDGTLVGFSNRPQDAVPPPDLISLLTRLAANPANTISVVSGRSRRDLEAWFGGVRGLWLAAEHGAIIRSPETMAWETHRAEYSNKWKEQVSQVLEHFVERTPGSLIEEKEFALVWHYRMADPEFGEWLANELATTLEQMLADTELRAFRGRKIVEVKPLWANKGEVMARLTEASPDAEFSFAAGDDRTDEDLFARLPDTAWTVHVGSLFSRARFYVSGPDEMRLVLRRFIEADEDETAAAAAARANLAS